MATPFFTATETSFLAQTWADRKRQLRRQQLEKHADVLYHVLEAKFQRARGTILDMMEQVCEKAHGRSELNIELWRFASDEPPKGWKAFSRNADHPVYENHPDAAKYREMYIRADGDVTPVHDTLLSMKSVSSWYGDAEFVALQEERVEDILRNSDVVARLTALFGADQFRVRLAQIFSPRGMSRQDGILQLEYYPQGVPEPLKLRQKVEERERYAVRSADTIFLGGRKAI